MTMTPDAFDAREDPVDARPRRRTFTTEYKREILAEIDAAEAAGDKAAKGAILRREGLYTSHIGKWRRTLSDGENGSGQRTPRSREQAEIDRLRERNARLEAELERTKTVLEIAGKARELLEMLSGSSAAAKRSTP